MQHLTRSQGMAVKYKFVGKDGEFYGSVPARDLTEEEFSMLPKELQQMVKDGDLYESASGSSSSSAKSTSDDEEKKS
jgi:hypothetical protein